MKVMKKRILSVLLVGILSCSGLSYIPAQASGTTAKNTTNLYTATDDLNRTLDTSTEYKSDKTVGVFYFLWLGATSAEGPYDVSKVLENNANAAESSEAWKAAGGGAVSRRHWWGESLFGYYCSVDEWVIERDVQMLTDAGVDFLALDYSNGTDFKEQLLVLMKALDKYYKQGYDVPKLTFITYADTSTVVPDLKTNIYDAYPEYEHLWYEVSDKPLLMLRMSYLSSSDEDDGFTQEQFNEWNEYFTIKNSRWPRDTESSGYDDFAWMDFDQDGDGIQTKHEWEDGTTFMSVSVAQHSGTLAFSSSAFYGDTTNHTRSYHDGSNDTNEDAVLQGYNFEEQFQNAIKEDVDMVFITGWNEWFATRQSKWAQPGATEITDEVILVDNADINNSRDIQPMSGGYGDNYYMQMINLIRQFKGSKTVNRNLNTTTEVSSVTIDVSNSFLQWNVVESFYLDYTQDIISRNAKGFGGLVYEDYTGRNDFSVMKVANDNQNLYFYVETASNITGMNEDKCMTLFMQTGNNSNTWKNYDFRTVLTSEGVVLEKYNGTSWVKQGTVDYRIDGNKLQLAIPLETLGYTENFSLDFKWADNYQDDADIYAFYLHGDAAPYGRLNYHYEGVCETAAHEYGDVTISGNTNSQDLIHMKKEVLQNTDVQPYGDMNADDAYDDADMDLLRKYLVGYNWPITAVTSAVIKDYDLIGAWSDAKLSVDGKSNVEDGPLNSYDGSTAFAWKPVAQSVYMGNPGVIYELNNAYNLETITLTFDQQYYFKLYTSQDGIAYTSLPVAEVNASSGHYATENGNAVCIIDLSKTVKADGVRYVKFVFTGSADASTTMNLKEIELLAEKEEADVNQIQFTDHEVVGEWDSDTNAETLYAEAKKSYDGNTGTLWNNLVKGASVTGYSGTPGIIYQWDGYYDLNELTVYRAANRYHYFDVYVSFDDVDYELVAQVTSANYQDVLESETTDTIGKVRKYVVNLSACDAVSSVKIVFTGDSSGTNRYLNLREVVLSGTTAKGTVQKAVVKNGTIDDASVLTVEGTVAKSYDGDRSTMWNPQVTNTTKTSYTHTLNGNTYEYITYTDKPSVTYQLDGYYDLERIRLDFDYLSDAYKTYRFNLYVSQDGTYYSKAATAYSENNEKPEGYAGETFILDASKYKNIQYIRLEILGNGITNTWISLYEISVYGTKRTDTNSEAVIIANSVSGWAASRESVAGYSPELSYDGDVNTYWNPQASGTNTAYTGSPNIVYTLNGLYGLNQLVMTFGNGTRVYHFDVYTSIDNVSYSKVASVNNSNAADYYELVNNVQTCAVDLSGAETVKYVKLVFTGTAETGGSTWLSVNDVDITGTKLQNQVIPVSITSFEMDGTWTKSQVNDDGSGHSTAGPQLSYDSSASTAWNPEASYSQGSAIIYKLSDYYNLDTIRMTFDQQMYFDISVSADNRTFTSLASVTADNVEDYCRQSESYYEYSFELPEADTSRYVKLVFTGRANSTSGWFKLYEVSVAGQETDAVVIQAIITEHTVSGTWANDRSTAASLGAAKSYDGDVETYWNPQATGTYTSFTGTPGIVYKLDQAYNLKEVKCTFGAADMCFEVYGSADGITYSKIGAVTEDTIGSLYSDATCTINTEEAEGIQYVKIEFTARTVNNMWVNFREVEVTGTPK